MGPEGGPQVSGAATGASGSPAQPANPLRQKPRVLFVCIGNSCRSQMAEGFARRYGDDAMIAARLGWRRRHWWLR